jgi:hypothetical protein
MVIRAARRAVISRLYQAGCAQLTEETTGSRAPWRAAARQLRVGACAVSMGEVLGAARRAVRSMLYQAGCAGLTEEAAAGSRAPWRAAARYLRVGACAVSMGDVLGAARRAVLSMLYQAGCA